MVDVHSSLTRYLAHRIVYVVHVNCHETAVAGLDLKYRNVRKYLHVGMITKSNNKQSVLDINQSYMLPVVIQ